MELAKSSQSTPDWKSIRSWFTKANKLDYIILSPALEAKVTRASVERRGVWGGKHGTLFPHIPEITKEIEAEAARMEHAGKRGEREVVRQERPREERARDRAILDRLRDALAERRIDARGLAHEEHAWPREGLVQGEASFGEAT